jgi:hypothetical protein
MLLFHFIERLYVRKYILKNIYIGIKNERQDCRIGSVKEYLWDWRR